jgi:excisionase family DNA binding protein
MRGVSMNEIDLSAQLRVLQRQVAELRELLVGGSAKRAKNPQADPEWLTPPQFAKQLGVQPEKVLSWIRSGELRAVNVADLAGRRPRWRMSVEAIEEFLRRREAIPRSTQARSTGYHYPQPCTDDRGKPKRESDGRFAKNIPPAVRVQRMAKQAASRESGSGAEWRPFIKSAIERFEQRTGIRVKEEEVLALKAHWWDELD